MFKKVCLKTLPVLLMLLLVLHSCKTKQNIYILYGESASLTEKLTAQHLKKDIEAVLNTNVYFLNDSDEIPQNSKVIVIGTPGSNQIINEFVSDGSIILSETFPGKRGGIWAKVEKTDREMVVLAGSDVQGMQYAVYDYCDKILGVDPFAFWSGNMPEVNSNLDVLNIQNKVISPPEIPILCYFENDVDELANIKSPKLEYDWEHYTEMINSLVRMKYNAIHIFDMLGRPEFFLRPEYEKVRPDYQVRISYIDSMINYAHDMGMQVQIDMALGYKIKPIAQEKADCWSENKEEWINTWRYYFEETPIGKADIFAFRPRNQVWDWEYKSTCGEDKVDVFNEVSDELGSIIDEYKPEATKVLICYHDGMEMFNDGFNPPKDWIVAWSDNGWGEFDCFPDSTKGYEFGTYMHAGFWLNHTVQDPCPVKLDTVMKHIVNRYGANKYCMVNGQQFRPFLLNLEVFSKIADNVNAFNGHKFYADWATKYFGKEASEFAVSSLKKLHEVQYDGVGYVQHLWEISEAIAYLNDKPIVRPGKPKLSVGYERVQNDFDHVEKRYRLIEEAILFAEQGEEKTDRNKMFYNDYVLLPMRMYRDLLSFETQLHKIAKNKNRFELTGDSTYIDAAIAEMSEAREALDIIYERRLKGDKNLNWQGWYHIENRRPNNGFPTHQMLDAIEANLQNLK